jgi:8-oxo-dGTP pyrophosphatase MutT (NUDIX family)
VPSADGLAFVFRAITPPGRTRRFDARFFVADAGRLKTDPDDFSHAEDELANLQWIGLDEVREFDLPFVTQVALAEIASRLPDLAAPESVPFFDNDAEQSLFRRLGGVHPMDTTGG